MKIEKILIESLTGLIPSLLYFQRVRHGLFPLPKRMMGEVFTRTVPSPPWGRGLGRGGFKYTSIFQPHDKYLPSHYPTASQHHYSNNAAL